MVWHTGVRQKYLHVLLTAGKLLQQANEQPTIVWWRIVTSRRAVICHLLRAQSLLKRAPLQANDRDELRELLILRESGGIILPPCEVCAVGGVSRVVALNQRSFNIVVISDEAHRSQYGLSATLDEQTGVYNTATPNTCAMRCQIHEALPVRRLLASEDKRYPCRFR